METALDDSATPPTVGRKTRGELEAELALAVARFHKETFGRGPVETRAVVRDGLAVAHVRGVLTAAEARLAAAGPVDAALIRRVRRRVTARVEPELRAAAECVLGVPVRAVLSDVATGTDEAVLVFALDRPPDCRANGGAAD
jgi:uncharacterized protein YbcI